MYADPTGHIAISIGAIIFAGVVGALFGAVAQAYTAVKNGGSAKEVAGAFVGGFITGLFSGIVMALGGAMAIAGASAVAVMFATVGVMTVGFGVGIFSNYVETRISGHEFSIMEATRKGAIIAIEGGVSFGLGFGFGMFGGYDSLIEENGFFKTISNSNSIYHELWKQTGVMSISRGVWSYLISNGCYMILRALFKKFFMRPFMV